MSDIVQGNLGPVTAYAYAKAGGYTGTEAEFQALMAANVDAAQYAEVVMAAAEQAEEDKDAAAESASEAAGSKTGAETAQAAAETAANYARAYTGAPRIAATAAAMTDHDLIYVYTGSETGYTAGNWYFWDGTVWASGGVYNSTALETDETLTISGAAADAKATGDKVGELKSALNRFEDGYGNLDIWYKAELLYPDRYADINPTTGKVIYRENAYGVGAWLLEVDGTKTYTSSQSMRTVVPLQEDRETPTTNETLNYVYSIDLSDYPNTKYLAISLEGITSTVISVGDVAQSGTLYPAWLYEFNHGKRPSYNATYSGITSDSSVGLPVSNCLRKNSRLMFVAEISSFGHLEIGYATGENGTGVKYNRFLIISNSVMAYTYYDYSASAMHQEDSVRHNLAITSGNIEVVIEELPDAKCRLTIGNNGNSFTHTFDGWVRNNRLSPYVTANWSIFGKSFFSWTCTDLSKGIWLLGDSYMAYEPERWAYYLEQNGYADNVLISSFPGAWSSTNIASFETLLKYGVPKYAVWGMGMNDGSDSADAPSNNWVTGRDNFLTLCENNHIAPIFCTIPTVPTVNNEQKNTWIRASGYRYIDFAKAVLATSSGSWGTGMLSGDGVHPTANGAKALYYQVLTDFPEIMLA